MSMINKRQLFESLLVERSAGDIEALVHKLQASNNNVDIVTKVKARDALCGTLSFVAFSCPGATVRIYDRISHAWLSGDLKLEKLASDLTPDKVSEGFDEHCSIPEKFWPEYWSLIDGPKGGYDATGITLTSAALSHYVDSSYLGIAERVAEKHPKADLPSKKQVPQKVDVKHLEALPVGSLGHDLHEMWVTNNFDPEVLDRDLIGLEKLPPALRYLNTRILQMHDVWHLVAGYETTGLHEIAISAFQLAQFGHNYSSMFLAGVVKMMNERGSDRFDLIMRIVSEAWLHGRVTPAFMAIEWEDHWHKSIVDIREEFSIKPFDSLLPADLFEQLSVA